MEKATKKKFAIAGLLLLTGLVIAGRKVRKLNEFKQLEEDSKQRNPQPGQFRKLV